MNPPLPYSIRPYQATDNESLWKLYKSCFAGDDTSYPIEIGPWDEDLNNIEESYLQCGGQFLMLYDQSNLLGMGAFLRVDDTTAKIMRMRIHPDHQRKGIGSMIYRQLELEAKNMGYKQFILDVHMGLANAQSFYKKVGFEKSGKKTIGDHECYIYTKSL
jgi:ribosomal protein S18 acetylase RimI-like enzyme